MTRHAMPCGTATTVNGRCVILTHYVRSALTEKLYIVGKV